MSKVRRAEQISCLSSPASAERRLADSRKRSQRSIVHPVFPTGGCMTCVIQHRLGDFEADAEARW
jgi:hypothetical protein